MTLDEIRRQYPDFASDLSDSDIINRISEAGKLDPSYVAARVGFKRNDPGFVSTLKRSAGQMLGGVGEIYGDITGNHDNALSNYAEDVEFRNPSGVNSLQDIADKPWLAVKEAAANGLTFMVPAKGIQLAGRGLQAARMATAARLVDNPVTQAAVAGLPSLEGIGQDQRASGEPENLLMKYGGAGVVGAIENLGGVQRMMNVNGLAKNSLRQEISELSKTPLRSGLKAWGRTGLEEGLEEVAQNPIEQWAGYKDPTSGASLNDTAFGGAMGVLGGLALGPLAGRQAYARHNQITTDTTRSTDLLADSTANYDDRTKAASFIRDGYRDQNWYDSVQEGLVQDRDAALEQHRLQMEEQARLDELKRIASIPRDSMGMPINDVGTGTVDPVRANPSAVNDTLVIGAAATPYTVQRDSMGVPLNTPATGSPVTFQYRNDNNAPVVGAGTGIPTGGSVGKTKRTKVAQEAQVASGAPTAQAQSEVTPTSTKPLSERTVARNALLARLNHARSNGLIDRDQFDELLNDHQMGVHHEKTGARLDKAIAENQNRDVKFDNREDFTSWALNKLGIDAKQAEAYKRWKRLGEFTGDSDVSFDSLTPLFPKTNKKGEATGKNLSHETVKKRLTDLHKQLTALEAKHLVSAITDEATDDSLSPGAVVDPNAPTGLADTRKSADDTVEKEEVVDDAATGDTNANSEYLVSEEAGKEWDALKEKHGTDIAFEDLSKEMQQSWSGTYTSAHEAHRGAVMDDNGKYTKEKVTTAAHVEGMFKNFNTALTEAAEKAENGDVEAEKLFAPKLTEEEKEAAKKKRVVRELATRDTLGDEVALTEAAIAEITTGNIEAATALVPLLNGPNGLRLKQLLRTHFRIPTKINAVPDILEHIAKYVDASFAATDAQFEMVAPHWGDDFDSLPVEAKRDFVSFYNNMSGTDYFEMSLPGAIESIQNEYGLTGQAGQNAEGLSGSDGTDVSSYQGSTTGSPTGGGSKTEVRVKKRRTIERPTTNEAGNVRFNKWNRVKALPDGRYEVSYLHTFHGSGLSTPVNKVFASEQDAQAFADQNTNIEALAQRAHTISRLLSLVKTKDKEAKTNINSVLRMMESQGFAHILDNVGVITTSARMKDQIRYDPATGKYEIALGRISTSNGFDGIEMGLWHEVGHAHDDYALGAVYSSSDEFVNEVIPELRKIYDDRLAGADTVLGDILSYPFGENLDASLTNEEAFAQLASIYGSELVRDELRELSPTAYDYIEGVLYERQNSEGRATGAESENNGEVESQKTERNRAVHVGANEAAGTNQSKTRAFVAEHAGTSGTMVYDDAAHGLKKLGDWLLPLHDLIDKYKGTIGHAKEWYESVQATVATRIALEKDAESIAARADKLGKDGYDRLNKFVAASTVEQKWGYDYKRTHADGSATEYKADPAMAKRFAELTPAEQQLAKDIFAHGDKMQATFYKLMKELGLSGVLIKTGNLDGPYAPLKRFGNFVAVLKSKGLRDAEQALAKDKSKANADKVADLKADPEQYVVSYFDTMGQAKAFAAENKKDFHFTDAFEKSVRADEGRLMKPETLQKVMSAIKADDLPASAKQAVEQTIREMYLETLDEHNARVSGMKRKNRAGYDKDMVRSFLSHARAQAGFLSNMKHGGTTNDLFYKMQEDAQPEKGGTRSGQDAFNILAAHYAANLQKEDTPIQDSAMAVTSAMQLATNPTYHLQNALQPLMTTVPRLAADFGNYGAAWGHVMDAYKTVGLVGITNIDPSKVRNPGLRAAIEKVQAMGLLDVGMQEDLGHFDMKKTGIAVVDTGTKAVKRALHKLRQISRAVEAANRIAATTAAYNMAIKHGKSVEEAQEYAVSVVQTTQGDFNRSAKPLILKKLPKVIGQYRTYQLMMAAMYVKAYNQAFHGATAEEKAIGKRMLAYKLFHAAMAGGALGMPLMNLVGLVFSAAGGDDDEPADLERALREAGLGDALLHGPLWFMGLDTKLAEDKIFSIMPYGDWDLTSKKGVVNTAASLAGPAVSQAGKFADGLGFMSKGEYYKGLEKLLPSGISNAMQAFRVANEGYTLKNGDLMVKPEDINGFELALDAVGLKSPEMRQMKWSQNTQYELTQFFSDRSKEIEHDYRKAYKDKDAEGMAEQREHWTELQAAKDRARIYFNNSSDALKKQPLSTLLKYPHTADKREAKLQKAYNPE